MPVIRFMFDFESFQLSVLCNTSAQTFRCVYNEEEACGMLNKNPEASHLEADMQRQNADASSTHGSIPV